jgi:alpha-L-arabinofuranosidase
MHSLNIFRASNWLLLPALALSIVTTLGSFAGTAFSVATVGDDSNPGTTNQPFKTIQKAATVMQPGDTCYVRAGTYREKVIPPRGGTSESQRIVYKAYPGERPVIKGSERITIWKNTSGTTWSVTLPDAFFGSYNPYTIAVSGPGLEQGGNNHVGEVYLDGKILDEFTAWTATHSGSTMTITCDFAGADPNAKLTEINVRDFVFKPVIASAVSYITVDGFEMSQSANNWAGNTCQQAGLISPWGGHHWTIQNCHIFDAKCAGISGTCIGSGDGGMSMDINTIGHQLIRNNLIERCGQNGIVGEHGLSSSIVEGNLIQDINPRKLFAGAEQGGMKFHKTTDLLIRNNIIRRVTNRAHDAPGIWADWANQGIRISGNIINVPLASHNLFFEADHGPNLVDNNILVGSDQRVLSDGTYYVHNLVFGSPMSCAGEPGRNPGFWVPHNHQGAGSADAKALENMSFNNIFVKTGPCGNSSKSDYNVYYEGAAKTSLDAHSIVASSFATSISLVDDSNGVTVSFKVDDAPQKVAGPLITRDYIGINSIGKQGIEDRDANPISVDKDILGVTRAATTTAGPFENLTAGAHTFRFTAGLSGSTTTSIRPQVGSRFRALTGYQAVFDVNGRKLFESNNPQWRQTGGKSLPQGVYFLKDGSGEVSKTIFLY